MAQEGILKDNTASEHEGSSRSPVKPGVFIEEDDGSRRPATEEEKQDALGSGKKRLSRRDAIRFAVLQFVVLLATGGAGGKVGGDLGRKAGESTIKALQTDLVETNAQLARTDDALGACEEGRVREGVGFMGKIGDKEAEAGGLREKLVSTQGTNKSLAEQLAKTTAQKDELAEEVIELQGENEKLTVTCLQLSAQEEIWEAMATGRPGEVLESVRNTLEIVPLTFTAEAQQALDKIAGIVTGTMETVRKMIVPLKEAAAIAETIILPMALTFDKILTFTQQHASQAGVAVFTSFEKIFLFAEGKLPPGEIKDFIRSGRLWVVGIEELFRYSANRDVEVMKKAVGKLTGGLGELDDLLTAKLTDPLLKKIQEAIANTILRGAEKRIGDWRSGLVAEVRKEELDDAAREEERLLALGEIRTNINDIMAVLQEQRMPLTGENIAREAIRRVRVARSAQERSDRNK